MREGCLKIAVHMTLTFMSSADRANLNSGMNQGINGPIFFFPGSPLRSD